MRDAHVVSGEPTWADSLLAEARERVAPKSFVVRARSDGVVVDLAFPNGRTAWPSFANGPDELTAVLAAEQRYLAEEVGGGTVPGETYLDKARERIRRACSA